MAAPNSEGSNNDLPGRWAEFIMAMNFSTARAGRSLKTENMKLLHGEPQLREPLLRYNRGAWSGARMQQQIAQNSNHIEAAAMQVVGAWSQTRECTNCQRDEGPFVKCATFPGIEGCANCHWVKAGPSCSLNTHPTPLGPAARRNSASQVTPLTKE